MSALRTFSTHTSEDSHLKFHKLSMSGIAGPRLDIYYAQRLSSLAKQAKTFRWEKPRLAPKYLLVWFDGCQKRKQGWQLMQDLHSKAVHPLCRPSNEGPDEITSSIAKLLPAGLLAQNEVASMMFACSHVCHTLPGGIKSSMQFDQNRRSPHATCHITVHSSARSGQGRLEKRSRYGG